MAAVIDLRRLPRGREYSTSRHRLFNPAKYGFASKVVELPLTAAIEATLVGVKRPSLTNEVTLCEPDTKRRREDSFLATTAIVHYRLQQAAGLPVNLLPDQLRVHAEDLRMFEDWAAAFGYTLHHIIQNSTIILSQLA